MDQYSYSTFFPQFMCRVYVDNNELQQNRVEKVIVVNVQFYHSNCPALYPTVIAEYLNYLILLLHKQLRKR